MADIATALTARGYPSLAKDVPNIVDDTVSLGSGIPSVLVPTKRCTFSAVSVCEAFLETARCEACPFNGTLQLTSFNATSAATGVDGTADCPRCGHTTHFLIKGETAQSHPGRRGRNPDLIKMHRLAACIVSGMTFSRYSAAMSAAGDPYYKWDAYNTFCTRLHDIVVGLCNESTALVLQRAFEMFPSGRIPCQYDGVYQIKGHHSPNMTGSLHLSREAKHLKGLVIAREHKTTKGPHANFAGKTIRCGEAAALATIMQSMLHCRCEITGVFFHPDPIRMDRDSSCRYEVLLCFPESECGDCFNHLTKGFHAQLLALKSVPCSCTKETRAALPRKHRRLDDTLLRRIRCSMKAIIIQHEGKTAAELAAALLNVKAHYCDDDHSKCTHHPTATDSGEVYQAQMYMNCPAQVAALEAYLVACGLRAQEFLDCIGEYTNLCEGMHRLFLVYRDKVSVLSLQLACVCVSEYLLPVSMCAS